MISKALIKIQVSSEEAVDFANLCKRLRITTGALYKTDRVSVEISMESYEPDQEHSQPQTVDGTQNKPPTA